MTRKLLVLAAAIFSALAANPAHAQKHTAVLNGVVLAPNGKPAANAVVTYQSGGGDTPHVVRTDAHGRFTIVKLRRDNYDLRASWRGMYSTWEKNIMVHSGQQKDVTLRLKPAQETTKAALAPPKN